MNISEAVKNELKSLEELSGIRPVVSRFGEVDIAYPASAEEYCALGGYSVAAVVVFSQNQEELPIERTYFQTSSEKIFPLEKIGVCVDDRYLADRIKETKDDHGNFYFENISFWAIPTGLFMDPGGLAAIDFKGERKAFVLLRGPWKMHGLVRECLSKHLGGQIKLAEHIPFEVMAEFVQREFISNNRIKL